MFFEPAPQPPLLQPVLTTIRNHLPPTLQSALDNVFRIPLNAQEIAALENMAARVPQGAHPAIASLQAVSTIIEERNPQLHRAIDLAVARSVLAESISGQRMGIGS